MITFKSQYHKDPKYHTDSQTCLDHIFVKGIKQTEINSISAVLNLNTTDNKATFVGLLSKIKKIPSQYNITKINHKKKIKANSIEMIH